MAKYRDFLISAAEEVGFAYVLAFIGLVLSGWTGVLSVSILTSAAVAAFPAALAALKSVVARFYGDKNTANFKS